MNSIKALLFIIMTLTVSAFVSVPDTAFAEGANTGNGMIAKSIDQCTNSYVLCMESCKNQHDSCKDRAGSDTSHCSSLYTQCQNGCRRALNNCIGRYSKNETGPTGMTGAKVSVKEPLNKLDKGKAVILYKDGTWEYPQADDVDTRFGNRNIRPAGHDVDSDGTWKNEGCPRLCPRKVRYCTEWLSDGKCKLWDYRTEWYCCVP